MMSTPTAPHRYYNPARRPLPSPYRSPLPSQYEAFSRYKSQQRMPQAQLSWRTPKRPSGLTQPTQPAGHQHQYTPQPFRRLFMPQRQHYPEQRSRLLSAPSAIPQAAPDTQSAPYVTRPAANSTTYNPPRQPINPAQAAPRQPYQSNQPYRGYQRAEEKGVYQVDKGPVEDELEGFYTTFENEADKVFYSNEGFDEVTVNFVGIETSCIKCRTTFPSRSKLHNHLKSDCLETSSPSLPAQTPSPISVIASKGMYQSFGSGLAFRGWTYATALITLTPEYLLPDSDSDSTACLDTGCGVTLVNKAWLSKRLSIQKVNTMSTPLKVRGIGASKHESGEFAALSLYFPGRNDVGQQVYASLTCEVHLVEGLRANLLIGNDIMSPEDFVINVKKRSVLIGSCGVTVSIDARQRGQFLTRRLLSSQETVVPPRSEVMVSLVPLPLPDDRDFLFHPATQANLTLFTHLVNYKTSKVLVRNDSSQTIRIPHRHRLGHIVDIAYDNYFLTNAHSIRDAATSPPSSQHLPSPDASSSFLPSDSSLETVLSNGVKVYGDATTVKQIAELVAEYPTI